MEPDRPGGRGLQNGENQVNRPSRVYAKAGTGSALVDELPPFLAAKNLEPFASEELNQSTTPKNLSLRDPARHARSSTAPSPTRIASPLPPEEQEPELRRAGYTAGPARPAVPGLPRGGSERHLADTPTVSRLTQRHLTDMYAILTQRSKCSRSLA